MSLRSGVCILLVSLVVGCSSLWEPFYEPSQAQAPYSTDLADAWAQRIGNGMVESRVTTVAVDAEGNTYVAGYPGATITFKLEMGQKELGSQWFLAKISQGGALRWVQGHSGIAQVAGGPILAVDRTDGRLYFASTVGGGKVGCANDQKNFESGIGGVILIAYDLDGNCIKSWAYSGKSGTPERTNVLAMAAAADGLVIAGVARDNQVVFGGTSYTTKGKGDILVVKLSKMLDFQGGWTTVLGGTGADLAYGTAIAANGDVLVTGAFSSGADLGAGRTVSTSGAMDTDAFVARLAGGDGRPLWALPFGSVADDAGMAVAEDAQGGIVAAGDHQAVLSGSSCPQTLGFGRDGANAFILGLDDKGACRWRRSISGMGAAVHGQALVSDRMGNLLLAGVFKGNVDFGGGKMLGAALQDWFLARFSGNDGRHLFSARWGGDGEESLGLTGVPEVEGGGGMVIDRDDRVTLAGASSSSAVSIGGMEYGATKSGVRDIFVLGLQPAAPIANDSAP